MTLRDETYWDDHYQLELNNFKEDGDEGEVWFGKGLSRKIADLVVGELVESIEVHLENKDDNNALKQTDIIDIGCGNAYLPCLILDRLQHRLKSTNVKLTEIATKILGIDYSKNSIELSKQIVESRQLQGIIQLAQCDFLNQNQLNETTQGRKYDYIIDKGTFDAICLIASDSEVKLDIAKRNYMKSLYGLARNETIFIFASCNHTEDELIDLFDMSCVNKLRATVIGKIETPKLQFGGKEGSQVTCLIFKFSTV